MSRVTNNSFDVKYAPQSLDEVVFASADVQLELQRYVSGETARPLILYGPYGTGKSTIATLLATHVDHFSPNSAPLELEPLVFRRANYTGEADLFKAIRESLRYMRSVVVFDELDLMGNKIIANTKTFIDQHQDKVLFIATTNHYGKLDQGHISRSNCLQIAPAPLDRWKPRIEKIFDAEGVLVPIDDELEAMLIQSKGDHRQFLSELQRHTEAVRQVAAE